MALAAILASSQGFSPAPLVTLQREIGKKIA
jgi:hypothetical protein